MSAAPPGLSAEQARHLQRIADGRPCAATTDAVAALADRGLVRLIPPEDAEAVRRNEALLSEAEALRLQARQVEQGIGLSRLGRKLVPGVARRARQEADELRWRADELGTQAQGQWVHLSSRRLVGLDLRLCAPGNDGAFLTLTESGRAALRRWLWSDVFEVTCGGTEAVQQRTEAFLSTQAALQATATVPDPRLDLAAAVLSRGEGSVERFRTFDRLSAQERWVSYDRLPLLAALSNLPGTPQGIWDRFWGHYETLRRDWDMPGSYETRYAALALLRQELDEITAASPLPELARRLRADGWSMSQVTDPVAARLSGLRLSATQIAARVQTLNRDLERGSATRGPFLALAAALAADSNLHPLQAERGTADVMDQRMQYGELVERYDEMLPRSTGEDSRRTLPPAVLALMPGSAEGNWTRYEAAIGILGARLGRQATPVLALLMVDAAYPEWFDATRFVWELGLAAGVADEASVFVSFSRMSGMYSARVGQRPATEPGVQF